MGHDIQRALKATAKARREGKVRACDACRKYKWIRHDKTECPTCLKPGAIDYAELVKPWERIPEAPKPPGKTFGQIWMEERMANHQRQALKFQQSRPWVDSHSPHILVAIWGLIGVWLLR